MKATRIRITPALAAEWLKRNVNNRKLRTHTVSDYARDMKNGNWRITHQGIAFNMNGDLIDGQHRLHAIIQAGVAIEMMVTSGVHKDAFAYLDGGLIRTTSDKLNMNSRVTEVAKFALVLSGELGRPTLEQVREYAEDMLDDATRLNSACPKVSKGGSSVPVRTAAIVLMREQPERAEEILATYSAIVRRRYESMSPAAQSFIRQVDSGRINVSGAGRVETFAKALVALDPTRNSSVVKVYDIPSYCKRAANVFKGSR